MLSFPHSPHEVTVFKNLLLEELTINRMGRNCTEKSLNFTSSRFASIMMYVSVTINGSVKREYGDSINIDRAKENRLIKTYRDLTSFITTLQLEKPGVIWVTFDRVDSHRQSVSIRMNAKYKYKENNDCYSYGGGLSPSPILYTLNDPFWIFRWRNGGTCIYSDDDFNSTVAAFIGISY